MKKTKSTKKQPFRRPEDFKKRHQKVTVSTRIKPEVKDCFEGIALENGLSVSELISHVLDDYYKWLLSNS